MDQSAQHKFSYNESNRRENGNNLECMFTGDHFLNIAPVVQTLRATISKRNFLKLRSFCEAKYTVYKTKHQPIEWEMHFLLIEKRPGRDL